MPQGIRGVTATPSPAVLLPQPQRHLQGMGQEQQHRKPRSSSAPKLGSIPLTALSWAKPQSMARPRSPPHLDVPVGIQKDVLQLQVSVHDPILQGKAEPGSAQGVGGREGMGRSLPFTHGR